MKRSHLRLASLIAAFGLLAVVLSLWMTQPAQSSELKTQTGQSHYVLCTSSAHSVYLAEGKTKFSGSATGSTAFADSASNHFLKQNWTDLGAHRTTSANSLAPLWLLNRSLLI